MPIPANIPSMSRWSGWRQTSATLPSSRAIEVQLLSGYQESIDHLVADIAKARHHVHLLYYIFGDDATGRRVADALKQAVSRGVKCRVLLDSLGSRRAIRTLAPEMRAAGVDIVELLPVRWFRRNPTRPDLRNHRKIAVIDGRIGYVGSQNIVDAGFHKGFVNEELVARVTGPVVVQLQAVYLTDYSMETGMLSVDMALFPPAACSGTTIAQVLPSGPGYPQENTECMIISLVHAAKKQVILTTPYFVPDEPLLEAIRTALLRGVEVHLVVSRKLDHLIVGLAQRSYYEELLGLGVIIHQYAPGLLHAKHVSIDDTLALVGSSNLDIRSFALNAEVSMIVYDPQVVAALRVVQERNMAMAERLTAEEWSKRPLWSNIFQNTARLVDSVL